MGHGTNLTRALAATAFVLAVVVALLATRTAPPETAHQSHEGHAHQGEAAHADTKLLKGGVWFDGEFDPTEPGQLKGAAENVFFAQVSTVGAPFEARPVDPNLATTGQTYQDLTVSVTEQPIKGDFAAQDTKTLRRLPMIGDEPVQGQTYLFFTNPDPASGNQFILAQPWGEQPANDTAKQDELRAKYGPDTFPAGTPRTPDNPDFEDSAQEVCTADAPDTCQPGTQP